MYRGLLQVKSLGKKCCTSTCSMCLLSCFHTSCFHVFAPPMFSCFHTLCYHVFPPHVMIHTMFSHLMLSYLFKLGTSCCYLFLRPHVTMLFSHTVPQAAAFVQLVCLSIWLGMSVYATFVWPIITGINMRDSSEFASLLGKLGPS